MHDATGDIGQTVVSTGMAIREAFVIEAHQMQDCGMEIVNVDDVFCNVDAVAVRFSVRHARLHASPGQPG